MTASDALTESGLGNKLGALTQVWSFFDPEHRGYVESSGLSDVLCSRLGSVEPSNMQVQPILSVQDINPQFKDLDPKTPSLQRTVPSSTSSGNSDFTSPQSY